MQYGAGLLGDGFGAEKGGNVKKAMKAMPAMKVKTAMKAMKAKPAMNVKTAMKAMKAMPAMKVKTTMKAMKAMPATTMKAAKAMKAMKAVACDERPETPAECARAALSSGKGEFGPTTSRAYDRMARQCQRRGLPKAASARRARAAYKISARMWRNSEDAENLE